MKTEALQLPFDEPDDKEDLGVHGEIYTDVAMFHRGEKFHSLPGVDTPAQTRARRAPAAQEAAKEKRAARQKAVADREHAEELENHGAIINNADGLTPDLLREMRATLHPEQAINDGAVPVDAAVQIEQVYVPPKIGS